ncbi:hypothetical protein [Edaphobacter albus]|uniref:hypothetical protein n=1 Tax=Edaphobacter sp. 4G125 TaxID=2763071 RepID=UPI001645E44F|nr:hypothetical protein [Edaphobacter sp. 4G125]QNI36226.1 hypothetical protein H7846_14750 [Edaphobacter sp. 4G125]
MDILLVRRKRTWRDTAWWRATWQSVVSALLMMVLVGPLTAYFAAQLMALSNQRLDLHQLLSELIKGILVMLPYLWAYFFALERIARQRRQDDPLPLCSRS